MCTINHFVAVELSRIVCPLFFVFMVSRTSSFLALTLYSTWLDHLNFLYSSSEERGLSRKHIIESIRGSLERLQLDYIDIVLIHRADPMCPMEGPLLYKSFLPLNVYSPTCHPLQKQKWFGLWTTSSIMAGSCIGAHRAGLRLRFPRPTTTAASSTALCRFASNQNIISSAERKSKFPCPKSTIN